jgi:hypothetical protein
MRDQAAPCGAPGQSDQIRSAFIRVVVLCIFAGALLAQPSLQITSPAGGTVVNPGQTITVTVTASAGGAFTGVGVVGEDPIGISQLLTAPPYQFAVSIPATTTPGQYALTAVGPVQGGDPVFSDPVSIDVERPDNPVSLRLEPSQLISAVGDRDPILVYGVFSDGSKYILSNSSRTTYSSSNSAVATVDSDGWVTAIAPGSAGITIANGPNASVYLPVTVVPAISVMPVAKRLYQSQYERFTARTAYADAASVSWSISPPGVGMIDATGLYTAPSTIAMQQTVTIIATSTVDSTKTAAATVTLYPAISVSVTPSAASLTISQTQKFNATVSNTVSTGVNWTCTPAGAGTIDGAGLYTAPSVISAAQTVTVTATSKADNTKSASASILLNPLPVPTFNSVTPTSGIQGSSVPITLTGDTRSIPAHPCTPQTPPIR